MRSELHTWSLRRGLACQFRVMALILGLWQLGIGTAKASEPDVILEVQLGPGAIIGFTLEGLRALPLTEFETSTVWTQGVDSYAGVLLLDLLHHIGHTPVRGAVNVRALDGYSAGIDATLITDQAPLLSFLRNGSPMSVRDQGPVWLIFPYDHNPAFRTESIYAKSVWQVRSIEVEH